MSLKERIWQVGESAWRAMPQASRISFLRATNATWLVGVVGLITNANGHVLLLEHRYRVPWRWGLPGGHVAHGERLELALEREVFEETGIRVRAAGTILDFELAEAIGAITVTLPATTDADSVTPKSWEIAGGGFFPPDKLPERMDRYQGDIIERSLRNRVGLEVGSRNRARRSI
ncbi:MAG: NUDIX hydrolase [Deltaproteobacteria bacterium]|nr:NUDIX hydrolase [Deltaproteobacteria bacterium]